MITNYVKFLLLVCALLLGHNFVITKEKLKSSNLKILNFIQQIEAFKIPEKTWVLFKNSNTGLCLTFGSDKNLIQSKCDESLKTQQWMISRNEKKKDNWIKISHSNGEILENLEGTQLATSKYGTAPLNESPKQNFNLKYARIGFSFKNEIGDKCLSSSDKNENSIVSQSACCGKIVLSSWTIIRVNEAKQVSPGPIKNTVDPVQPIKPVEPIQPVKPVEPEVPENPLRPVRPPRNLKRSDKVGEWFSIKSKVGDKCITSSLNMGATFKLSACQEYTWEQRFKQTTSGDGSQWNIFPRHYDSPSMIPIADKVILNLGRGIGQFSFSNNVQAKNTKDGFIRFSTLNGSCLGSKDGLNIVPLPCKDDDDNLKFYFVNNPPTEDFNFNSKLWYKFENVETGTCLTAKFTYGVEVTHEKCDPKKDEQRFKVLSNKTGTGGNFIETWDGFRFELKNDSKKEGTKLWTQDKKDQERTNQSPLIEPKQDFYMVRAEDGTWKITTSRDYKCLTAKKGNIVSTSNCQELNQSQMYIVSENYPIEAVWEHEWVQIRSEEKEACVSVSEGINRKYYLRNNCNKNDNNMKYKFIKVDKDTYVIQNKFGLVMDLSYDKHDNNNPIWSALAKNDKPAQKWKVIKRDQKYLFEIRNAENGKCLKIGGEETIVIKTCDKNVSSQNFHFMPLDPTHRSNESDKPNDPINDGVQIIDRTKQNCANGGLAKKLELVSNSCEKAPALEKFVFTKADKGSFLISLKLNDLLLEIKDHKKDDKNTYTLNNFLDETPQKWKVTPRPEGKFYEIRNVHSDKCMELVEDKLIQMPCDSKSQKQDFSFNPDISAYLAAPKPLLPAVPVHPPRTLEKPSENLPGMFNIVTKVGKKCVATSLVKDHYLSIQECNIHTWEQRFQNAVMGHWNQFKGLKIPIISTDLYFNWDKTQLNLKRAQASSPLNDSNYLKDYQKVGNYYQIKINDGLCFGHKDSKLITLPCDTNNDYTLFYFLENNKDTEPTVKNTQWYRFENVGNGKCMTSRFDDKNVITMEPCDENRDEQRFMFKYSKLVRILVSWHGYVIDTMEEGKRIVEDSKIVLKTQDINPHTRSMNYEKAEDETHILFTNDNKCFTTDKQENSLVFKTCKTGDYFQMFKIIKNDTPNPIWVDEWVHINHIHSLHYIYHPEVINSYYYTYGFADNATYRYKFLKTENGSYIITSKNTEAAMGLGQHYKDRAQDAYSRNLLSQRWELIPNQLNPIEFYIKNVENGNCLQKDGGMDQLIHKKCNFEKWTTQLFTFFPADPTYRTLKSITEKGVQILDRTAKNCVFSSLSRESDISSGKCDVTPTFEKFVITYADNGSFLISLQYSALPIAIKYIREKNKEPVEKDSYELQVFKDEPIFKWKITPRKGTSFFEIRSVFNDKCWEISQGKVEQKACTGGEAQDFSFNPDISSFINSPKPALPAVPVHAYRNYNFAIKGSPVGMFNLINKAQGKCVSNTNTQNHFFTLVNCNRNSWEQRFLRNRFGQWNEDGGFKTAAFNPQLYFEGTPNGVRNVERASPSCFLMDQFIKVGEYYQIPMKQGNCMGQKDNKLVLLPCKIEDDNTLFSFLENDQTRFDPVDRENWYRFENIANGKCMTSNFKSDKGVTMETCDENRDDQRFKFVRPINDKDYDVFTTWDGKVIELQNKKDKIGSKFVTVYKKDKHSGEGIKWVEAEDRTFRFYSYQTDNCLTTDKEINSLILKSCKDNDYHQMFKIIQNETPNPIWIDEWVYIRNGLKAVYHPDKINSLYYVQNFADSDSTKFKLLKSHDDSYIIVSKNEESAMDLGKNYPDRVQADGSKNLPSQRWKLISNNKTPPKFYIKNEQNGNCVQERSDSLHHVKCRFQNYESELFSFQPVDPTLRFFNKKSNEGIQILDRKTKSCVFSSFSNGSDILSGKCGITPSFERFIVTDADNGAFLISLKYNGMPVRIKYITERWKKPVEKDSYELNEFKDEPIFKWKITLRKGTQFYEIRSVANDKCWEYSQGTIVQKSCTGSESQDFSFNPDISSFITASKPSLPAIPVHPYRINRIIISSNPQGMFSMKTKVGGKCVSSTNVENGYLSIEECNRNSWEQRFLRTSYGSGDGGLKTAVFNPEFYFEANPKGIKIVSRISPSCYTGPFTKEGNYYQIPFKTGQCMGYKDNKIIFLPCNTEDDNTLFEFIENEQTMINPWDRESWYKFENIANGKCMTSVFKSGVFVTMEPCDANRDDQRFKFISYPNKGDSNLITTWDNKVVELQNNSKMNGSKFILVNKKDPLSGAEIKWVSAEDGSYRLYSSDLENCLTTEKEGNSVVYNSCKTVDYNQMFKVRINNKPSKSPSGFLPSK